MPLVFVVVSSEIAKFVPEGRIGIENKPIGNDKQAFLHIFTKFQNY